LEFGKHWREFTLADNYLRGRAFFADGEIIEQSRRYAWDDILLAEEVKRTIRTHVEGFLTNRDRLKALGVKARRGIILEGPPGTGKTLLGKVLANMLCCSFIWVTPRHVTDAASFNDILTLARFVAPTVLFLEDLDLFGEDRDANMQPMRMGELMNQLDGVVENQDIVTIATTNHIVFVEKALRNRPGRFDRVVHIGTMDESCRARMLAKLLAKANVSPDDLSHLVAATDGYTGAQIEELANTLYILALDSHTHAETTGGNGRVVVTSALIAAALKEVTVERQAKAGFGA
jgi:ATP-dependent 26S proteasome regulatory subunit